MIKPLYQNIIVEKKKEEKKTSGLLLQSQSEITSIGRVISVGKEVKEIEENQKILYFKKDAIEIEYEKKNFIILTDRDVIAIVEEDQ